MTKKAGFFDQIIGFRVVWLLKILLMVTLTVLTINGASAAVNDAVTYLSTDDDDLGGGVYTDLTGNGNDGIVQGGTTGVAAVLEEGFENSGAQASINLSGGTGITGTTWGLSLWVYLDTCTGSNKYFLDIDDATRVALGCEAGTNKILTYNAAGGFDYYDVIGTAGWHHIVINANGEDWKVWYDGHNNFNGTSASVTLDGGDVCLGAYHECVGGAGQAWDGKLDEISFYNHELTASDVNILYNGGAGYNPYETSSVNPNIRISAFDYYNNESINNFNLTLNNGTQYGTTNGTIYIYEVPINNYTFNATYPDYFNVTNNVIIEASANGTTFNKQVYPYTAIVSFEGYELLTGSNAGIINFTINGTTVTTNNTIILTDALFNVTAWGGGYHAKTDLLTITKTYNESLNVSGLYEVIFNLFLRNSVNSSLSNNATVQFNTTIDGNTYENTTANIINNYTYYTQHGHFNFSSLPSGYALTFGNYSTEGNTTNTTINFYLPHFTTNSVSLYFYDEENYTLLKWETIYIDFISDVFSSNYSTTTGTKYVDLLSPTEYNLRYYASGYSHRTYYFTLLNNTYTSLNLTLLKLSSGSNITITVYDNLRRPLVNTDGTSVRVKMLKYIVPTNSFRLIEVLTTNYEGQTSAVVEKFTEYYKFIVEYNSEIVLETSPTYIYDDDITLVAYTISDGFSSLFELLGLYATIGFNDNNNIVTYTFNDEQNTATQGCAYIYLLNTSTKTLVNNSCTAGAAGTLYLTIQNVTGSYEVQGYITKNGQSLYLINDYVTIGGTQAFDDADSLLWSAVLIMLIFFLGYFALELAVVLGGLAQLILSAVGLINIGLGYSIPVFIVCLVAAFMIYKRRSHTAV